MDSEKTPNRPLREWTVRSIPDDRKDTVLDWACKRLRSDITDAYGVGSLPQVYDNYDLISWLMDKIISGLDDDIQKYTDAVNKGACNIRGPGIYMDPDAIAIARWYLTLSCYSTDEGPKHEPGEYKHENLQG